MYLVIGGGVIPDADIPGLKKAGVAAVFTPGTPTGDIVRLHQGKRKIINWAREGLNWNGWLPSIPIF